MGIRIAGWHLSTQVRDHKGETRRDLRGFPGDQGPNEFMCNLSTPNGNQICFKDLFEVKNQPQKSSLIIVDYKIQKDHSDWNQWIIRAFCWKLTPSHLLIASMNSTQLLDGLVSLCSCIEANKCSGFSILNAVGLAIWTLLRLFFSTHCSICMLPPRRFHLGGFLWSMRSSSSMHPSAQRSRGGRPRVRDGMLGRWCETFQNSYTHKKCLNSAFFPISWHLADSV